MRWFFGRVPFVELLVGADRLALRGLRGPVTVHEHATAAVIVGLHGPLQIRARGRTRDVRAALLAPGFRHALDLRGGALAVFLLPPGALAGDEVRELDAGPWLELTTFEEADRALRTMPHALDDRLARVLQLVAARLDENVPLDALAAEVRLSPTRLMTLAREQLRTSLRGFRRWLRTFEVARAYASGANLTEAAHRAGFSSSAHLSAAAREHFGIRPSQVLSPATRAGIATR